MKNKLKSIGLFLTVLSLAVGAPAQTFSVLRTFNPNANSTGLAPESRLVQGPDNTLYGTASGGGINASGVVFKIQPDGTGFTVIRNFSTVYPGTTTNSDGANPYAGLMLSGNKLFGTTVNGGTSGFGTVFSLNTDGSGFTTLYSFTGGADGANPIAEVILSGATLYGTTYDGGSSSNGTVFEVGTNGSGFNVLYSFTGGDDGGNPRAELLLSNGILYGTTENGGPWDWGTVFALTTSGDALTTLYSFGFDDGANPFGGLVLSGSELYGTAENGGSDGWGNVFTIDIVGGGFKVLKNFTGGSDGANPYAGLVLSDGMLYGTAQYGGGPTPNQPAGGTVFGITPEGNDFIVLKSLPYRCFPYAGLLLSGNTFYGTTFGGGTNNGGTVFKVNIDRSNFAVLENFATVSGEGQPATGVILWGNTLYGTTTEEGGTVYGVNSDGSGYAIIHSFPLGGGRPCTGLTLTNSTLYGIDMYGGNSEMGAVYAVNTNGDNFTEFYLFTSLVLEGPLSKTGPVLRGSTLYGTAGDGGTFGEGSVFAVNTNGFGFTNLHSFGVTGAIEPTSGVLLSGSTLYGATGSGTLFAVNTNGSGFTNLLTLGGGEGGEYYSEGTLVLSGSTLFGTTVGYEFDGIVFAVNTNGTGFTNLHTFIGSDGASPYAGLVLSGSTLYGTTSGGGSAGEGTVYMMNTNGSGFAVLYNFSGAADGANPYAGLVYSGGILYGTAENGGAFGAGTLFALNLSVPLNISKVGGQAVLTWSKSSFSLQSAPSPTGVYTNVIGAASPYTNAGGGPIRFFRLQGN